MSGKKAKEARKGAGYWNKRTQRMWVPVSGEQWQNRGSADPLGMGVYPFLEEFEGLPGLPTRARVCGNRVKVVWETVEPVEVSIINIFGREMDGSLELASMLVDSRIRVGDLEILICNWENFPEIDARVDTSAGEFRAWVRTDAGVPGRWGVWRFEELEQMAMERAAQYRAAGEEPEPSARFPLPIRAGDAIALIEGGDFR